MSHVSACWLTGLQAHLVGTWQEQLAGTPVKYLLLSRGITAADVLLSLQTVDAPAGRFLAYLS